VDVSPLEMAEAVSVVPQLGVHIEATPIKVIKDFEGNIIEDNRFPYKEPVLSEATCSAMIHCLEMVISGGTGYKANIGRPAGGKTGTTDLHRDAWFVGFTPELTTAVWVGNSDNSRMSGAFGGDIAAPIWASFMKPALEKTPIRPFGVLEKGKVGVLMCSETHRRAAATCPDCYRAFFDPGAVPVGWCRKHSIDSVGGVRFADANHRGGHAEEVPLATQAAHSHPKPAPHHQDVAPADAPAEDVPVDVQATPAEGEPPAPVDIHPADAPPVDSQPAPPPQQAAPPPPPPPPPPANPPPIEGEGPDR
jgi:membrane peptidoglycan carboxypeptidase